MRRHTFERRREFVKLLSKDKTIRQCYEAMIKQPSFKDVTYYLLCKDHQRMGGPKGWLTELINYQDNTLLNELVLGLREVISQAWPMSEMYYTDPKKKKLYKVSQQDRIAALRLAKDAYRDLAQIIIQIVSPVEINLTQNNQTTNQTLNVIGLSEEDRFKLVEAAKILDRRKDKTAGSTC